MASFSKMITKTDAEKRLSLPIKFLESLPPLHGGHAVDFQAKDENAELWTFRCCTRKKGRYRKPVLSKGWRAFASRKKLKVGDRIEFYEARNQSTDESPCYGVRVEREIKLLGSRIGYAPLLSEIKPF
ncbi:B3 domain-containing transcription factor [Salix suchowensis]|nr:B3 domain-containing transcription factor [Salix suchowensis]